MARSLRLTAAELEALRPKIDAALAVQGETAPKYRNRPTVYNGRRYGSKLEAQLAAQFDNEWRAGAILWYTTQVPFVLEGGVVYRADFLVVRPHRDGVQLGGPPPGWRPTCHIEVIDSTGVMTQTKYNKLKQMEARYKIIVMIHRSRGGLVPYQEVKPNRLPSK